MSLWSIHLVRPGPADTGPIRQCVGGCQFQNVRRPPTSDRSLIVLVIIINRCHVSPPTDDDYNTI